MVLRGRIPKAPIERSMLGRGLVWAGAVAAMAGLVGQAIRMGQADKSAGLLGGIVVGYVAYLALSTGMFWSGSRSLLPATLLICGSLWTLALQALEEDPGPTSAVILLVVPVASLVAVRLLFGEGEDDLSPAAGPSAPETVRALLDRHKGFGPGR